MIIPDKNRININFFFLENLNVESDFLIHAKWLCIKY